MLDKRKSVFVAIVGIPNVGKSSILNAMLGQKISIVSSKPQTTRTRIMGILTRNDTQLVFIDTPGIHSPRNRLGEYMEKSINESVSNVDVCLLVVEPGREAKERELELMERFKKLGLPSVLAINKIDTLSDKSILMKQIKELFNKFKFNAVVPVSAKNGDGIEALIKELSEFAQETGFFFDEDTLTDQPERVIISEIIREKILRLTNKEIPHGVAISIERMKERTGSSGIVDIDATIYCEKSTHKGILIGKNGSKLKEIGTSARRDIEKFLSCKINLQLWVKVKEGWRNREGLLRNFGFNEKDF